MRSKALPALLTLSAMLFAATTAAARVDNFVLLDQNGASQELYYLSDREAVVIMIQGNGCPVVRNAWPTFRDIRERYESQGVAFLMLNSNLQDERDTIAAEAADFGYDIPILVDGAQLIGEALGVVRTSEVFVIDPDGWELIYRGPIDDRLTYERQLAEAGEHYLRDTLDAVLAGQPVEVAERDALGCIVNFPYRDSNTTSAISYSETIAPLLEKNCVTCHREGGIAPWAMSSHRMVLGFAPMIREVVRTRRMPPWHSDPEIGEWVGENQLSRQEMADLVHWVEAGAPRGDGPDPLESLEPPASEWTLGEPDLVVTLPPFEVPATGVVAYQYPSVSNPLDRPVWVRAAAIAPGERTVVHHVLVGYSDGPAGRRGGDSVIFENYLNGYAPGMQAQDFPDDTGVYLEPGGSFHFQMHYTPIGKAETDVTRLGLYFHDEPPQHILRHNVALNPRISIPPMSAAHEETAYLLFDEEAILYSLFPHAHYRGRSSKFEIEYPDGRTELLLSVPKYDFNWQRDYAFETPLRIPAGSKLVHSTVYDNSVQNPGNPDPSRRVPWGQQSWDEMLYGAVRFRWVDETADNIVHSSTRARLQQLFGYLDADRDLRLTVEELPPTMRARIGQNMALLDRDGDGALSLDEYPALGR